MRRTILVVALVARLTAFVSDAGATPGAVDTTFAGTGFVAPYIGGVYSQQGLFFGASIADVAVQPDGKIVAVGSAYRQTAAGPPAPALGILVLRYNADGTLDRTWGGDGIVYTPDVDSSVGVAVTVSGGKVYVAGAEKEGPAFNWVVLRYTSTGENEALTAFPVGPSSAATDVPNAIAVLSGGSVVVGGTDGGTPTRAAVARLTPSLLPDNSWAGTGIAYLDASVDATTTYMFKGMDVTAGGSVYLGVAARRTGGAGTTQPVIARFKPDGTLDSTWGTGGLDVLPAPTGQTFSLVGGMTRAPDGSLYLAGGAGLEDYAMHVTALGAPDAGFGTGGQVVLSSSLRGASEIAVQADGKPLIAGPASQEATSVGAVERLTTSGTPDPTYGSGGLALTASLMGNVSVDTVALDADGRAIVGGTVGGSVAAAYLARFGSDTAPVAPLVQPTPTVTVTAPAPAPVTVTTQVAAPVPTTSPVTASKLTTATLAGLLAHKLKLSVTCARACRLSLKLVVSATAAKKGKLGTKTITLATATGSAGAAGTVTLVPKAASSLLKALRKLHASLTVSIALTATDTASGRAFSSTKSLTLKPPAKR